MTVRTLRTKVMAVAVTAASLLAIVAAAPASAGGPTPSATVYVVHGIPGQRVDVCIAGLGEIASRMAYATRIRQELDPGTYSMKVRKVSRGACKGDVITKTALNLVDQDNVTAVIRIDAGQPAVTKFDNDVSPTAVGHIRLIAAHMMKGGAVDVWANGVVEIIGPRPRHRQTRSTAERRRRLQRLGHPWSVQSVADRRAARDRQHDAGTGIHVRDGRHQGRRTTAW